MRRREYEGVPIRIIQERAREYGLPLGEVREQWYAPCRRYETRETRYTPRGSHLWLVKSRKRRSVKKRKKS